jgi:hypothetical protein
MLATVNIPELFNPHYYYVRRSNLKLSMSCQPCSLTDIHYCVLHFQTSNSVQPSYTLHSDLGGVTLLLGQHPACCPSYIPAASFKSFIACCEVNVCIYTVSSSLQEIVQTCQLDGLMDIPI